MTNQTQWYIDAVGGLAKTQERWALSAAICERHGVRFERSMTFNVADVKAMPEAEREAFLEEMFNTLHCSSEAQPSCVADQGERQSFNSSPSGVILLPLIVEEVKQF